VGGLQVLGQPELHRDPVSKNKITWRES
jgi:hypothetical protein